MKTNNAYEMILHCIICKCDKKHWVEYTNTFYCTEESMIKVRYRKSCEECQNILIITTPYKEWMRLKKESEDLARKKKDSTDERPRIDESF